MKSLVKLVRTAYFAACYNTMLPVNAVFALGAITPLQVFLAVRGTLSLGGLAAVTIITLITAYFYQLIYVVNDLIDRRKDVLLAIPKQTSRQLVGRGWGWYLAAAFGMVTAGAALVWPALGVLLVSYGLGLMVLSMLHSRAGRAKIVTIFIERWAKFCAPFVMTCLVFGSSDVKLMLDGALLIYPASFTFDYAFRGYLRDRLKLATGWRFVMYAAYWAIVLAWIGGSSFQTLATRWYELGFYAGIYFGMVAFTYLLARRLPLKLLDQRYPAPVALEKRRLVTFGLVTAVILVLGGGYAYLH